MKTKLSVAISSAFLSMVTLQASASASAVSAHKVVPTSYNKATIAPQHAIQKMRVEKTLDNAEYTYIVRLVDEPIATYDGTIKGLKATNPQVSKKYLRDSLRKSRQSAQQIRNQLKIDLQAQHVKAYAAFIDNKQNTFINHAQKKLGRSPAVLAKYKKAFNGIAMRMTQAQAIKLSELSDVAFIHRENLQQLHTDTGPTLIGAPNVWDGSATGTSAMGEGVIIGVVDTGINTDHPSFADIGGDGYDHVNPWGAGVYTGDCANGYPQLCNDKLIGVHSYSVITDAYQDSSVFGDNPPAPNGEDYNGHGSHTASTSGGNILLNVPLVAEEIGKVEGDGLNTSGFEFEQISGVAPHANIIAYQICWPGDNGDTYSRCPDSAILAALEDAIEDGVDVINFSIGGGQNPWQQSSELAFLAAQEAGIFSAVSAGNSGPDANTTEKSAPWYTIVAASTHGRSIEGPKEIKDFSGGTSTLEAISGNSVSGGITASIVYAGDFTNANDPDNDSAQCLKPFPDGTFTGQIVVCDRGSIARVEKAENVASGGAGGYVLANVDGGSDNIADDVYVVPGIHISASDGNRLKAWLSDGTDHMATITAGGERVIGQADDIAGFSSRGPNSYVSDILTPSVAAPGVSIYAAYADQMFGRDVNTPAPADYTFLQGTSMASPHVAGAGAVLKSLHPTWTPDNIRSALMMTATTSVRKEDGTTAADFFDMGAGRINVDLAAQAGLIMNETAANYRAADPAIGGEPKDLNVPSVTNTNCLGTCSWTRTFTATKAGTWTVSDAAISGNIDVSASPETFTLQAGESQTITISADSSNAPANQWSFGLLELTADSQPSLHLPVSVIANKGTIPQHVDVTSHRNADFHIIKDVTSIGFSDLTVRSYGLIKPTLTSLSLPKDSNNSSVYDDLSDGVHVSNYSIANDTKRFVVQITASDSPDLDIFVGKDDNGDGIPQAHEQIAASATATALEKLQLTEPSAGDYWVIVQNWASAEEGSTDGFTLATAIVDGEERNNLSASTTDNVGQFTPFDITLNWTLDSVQEGDLYYGAIDFGTDASNPGNMGLVAVDLVQGASDVSIKAMHPNQLDTGDSVNFTVSIAANTQPIDKEYTVTVDVPDDLVINADSISHGGNITGNSIAWTINQASMHGQTSSYLMTSNANSATCEAPDLGQSNTGGYVDLAEFGLLPDSFSGDTVHTTYTVPVTYMGTTYDSFSVTDDGFIYFSGSKGSNPWVNQLIPDSSAPNNLLAPFWRDMVVVSNSESGLTVADGFSNPDWIVIELDNMRPFAYFDGDSGATDIADYQIILNKVTGDFIFAYDNITHTYGDSLGVTVGYESADGSFGRADIYAGSSDSINSVTDITSGTIYCYQYQPIDLPTELTFVATVSAQAVGGDLRTTVTSAINSMFTESESVESNAFAVQGPPVAVISGPSAVTEGMPATLSASSSTDPNGDTLTFSWRQTSGTAVTISEMSSQMHFTAPIVEADQTLTFELTATDSTGKTSTATKSVTVTNNRSGGGTMMWLLLLLLPIGLMRRRNND
ncbi:S8 family serine peptidase [Thalassotalea fusca]